MPTTPPDDDDRAPQLPSTLVALVSIGIALLWAGAICCAVATALGHLDGGIPGLLLAAAAGSCVLVGLWINRRGTRHAARLICARVDRAEESTRLLAAQVTALAEQIGQIQRQIQSGLTDGLSRLEAMTSLMVSAAAEAEYADRLSNPPQPVETATPQINGRLRRVNATPADPRLS